MESLVAQSRLLEQLPVVVNNLNLAKPAAGQPTLLSMDEIRTLFHEFGHALHGLLSSVTYPRLAGTAVSKDFVEYPSQVNEMWGTDPELLAGYARHIETGEPLPADQIAALQVEGGSDQARETISFLAATWLDLAWHRLTEPEVDDAVRDIDAFEARVLGEVGLDMAAIPPRYRSRYFNHIFSPGTRPATTPTSGARSSTPIPSSGSPSTVTGCGRPATRSGPSCSAAGGAGTRWATSRRSGAAPHGSSRCCAGGDC